MQVVSKFRQKVTGGLLRLLNRTAFEEDFVRTLPGELRGAAELLFFNRPTASEREVAKKIESFRDLIPSLAEGRELHSYSSPHSNTFETDARAHAVPGEYAAAMADSHAATGVGTSGGLLLRRIVEGLGIRSVLELGTNTGFSGSYFLSAQCLEQLVTVEGSAELSQIAETHLQRTSDRFRLMNMLFDEAIDLLADEKATFDCAFLDGQHEREATLHYARRLTALLNPGGVIVFDDIYWSDGMNQAWKELCQWPSFSVTVDLRGKGLCILGDGAQPGTHHDICDYIGRPRIFRKDW